MRGADVQQSGLFSYVSVEERVPANHPLRGVRALLDEALQSMHRDFERVYAEGGRASIPPERLVRALTLQILYSIRSERLLCEQLDYNLLFRWFVGLSVDEPVWDHSTFTKNRERLIEAKVASEAAAPRGAPGAGRTAAVERAFQRRRHPDRIVGGGEEHAPTRWTG